MSEIMRLCGGREQGLQVYAAYQSRRYPPTSVPGGSCALCGLGADLSQEQHFIWEAATQHMRTFWLTISAALVRLSHVHTESVPPTEQVFLHTYHRICPRCATRCRSQRRWATWLRRAGSVGAVLAGFVAAACCAILVALTHEPGALSWGLVRVAAYALGAVAACVVALWWARRISVPKPLRKIGRRPFRLFLIVPLEQKVLGLET